MFKLLFMVFFSVVISRWMYAEVQLLAPGAVPVVDALLEKTSIPTHDHWSKDSIDIFYKRLAKYYQVASKTLRATDAADAEDKTLPVETITEIANPELN